VAEAAVNLRDDTDGRIAGVKGELELQDTTKYKTLKDLAQKLGFDHFNWYQIAVEFNPDKNDKNYLDLYNAQGTALAKTFIDPPPGGLAKKNANNQLELVQWADKLPWYWDEKSPAAGSDEEKKWDKDYAVSSRTTNTTLSYVDRPNFPFKAVIKFKTWLVGVDKDGKLKQFFGGFSWSLKTEPNANVASDLKYFKEAPTDAEYKKHLEGFA
jgi:hypothetical protein